MSPRSLKTLSHAVAPDLFGVAPAWPEGLSYQPGFINAKEERELIALFQSLPAFQHDKARLTERHQEGR